VQTASYFHHHIRDAVCGEAQQVFDNPTPLDACDDIFDDDPHTRTEFIQQFVGQT
jgi:hypothetical protein